MDVHAKNAVAIPASTSALVMRMDVLDIKEYARLAFTKVVRTIR